MLSSMKMKQKKKEEEAKRKILLRKNCAESSLNGAIVVAANDEDDDEGKNVMTTADKITKVSNEQFLHSNIGLGDNGDSVTVTAAAAAAAAATAVAAAVGVVVLALYGGIPGQDLLAGSTSYLNDTLQRTQQAQCIRRTGIAAFTDMVHLQQTNTAAFGCNNSSTEIIPPMKITVIAPR
ncbi:unnamed protein product [Enterobius vermicularis]|uniref:Uncharacterized protein n=1 Tax=Enterobius vermicularis TaxID=51028 RepID=A0A0N4VFC1_ENTVE|nr:unnamed protein product [Enterobius vermicularis]